MLTMKIDQHLASERAHPNIKWYPWRIDEFVEAILDYNERLLQDVVPIHAAEQPLVRAVDHEQSQPFTILIEHLCCRLKTTASKLLDFVADLFGVLHW